MKLADFDYTLPRELIAQRPLDKRDASRLLVVERKSGAMQDRAFTDICAYLDKGDALVLNNTKVLPARLIGRRKSGGKVEILLLENKAGLAFRALLKPSRVKTGEEILFGASKIKARITARQEVVFDAPDAEGVYRLGKMPLPPYIKRDPGSEDDRTYQTVYASSLGAIAAPTAGLHFSEKLLKTIFASGVNEVFLTLHVGYSTFRPVKAENIEEHKMDKEYFSIDARACELIDDTKRKGKRIFAVGTTSCRALEAYAGGSKGGYTDLFIYPGYKFKLVDCLLTNFHLPRSTLLMLAAAFAGKELIKKAYARAIEKKYRFYSYGDAMLIV